MPPKDPKAPKDNALKPVRLKLESALVTAGKQLAARNRRSFAGQLAWLIQSESERQGLWPPPPEDEEGSSGPGT